MSHAGIQYLPQKGIDARFGRRLIQVKAGVDAVRTLRGALFRMAEVVVGEAGAEGVLLLTRARVTERRIRAEWESAKRVMREDVLSRLSICVLSESGAWFGVPRSPDEEMRRVLGEVAARATGGKVEPGYRTDFAFAVQKVLVHNYLAGGKAMSVGKLAARVGCSFPTAAIVVKKLGGLIERTSDRRVGLKYFSREQYDRFAARSEAARMTVRFSDASGQPRSPESLVRRLEKLRPEGVAIGGVLGARHYFDELDLVGTPRLDLSVHAPAGRMNLDFVRELDPALRVEKDAEKSVSLVVHAVRHVEALFERREGGLMWADEVECWLDLREAGLGAQAQQFLNWLERRASAGR